MSLTPKQEKKMQLLNTSVQSKEARCIYYRIYHSVINSKINKINLF